MHKIFFAVFAACIVYYVYIMYRDYQQTELDPNDPAYDTWMERVLYVGRGSLVKVWARITGLVSVVIGFIISGSAIFYNPDVTEALKDYLDPTYVTIGIAILMAMSEMFRNRTSTE